MVIKSYDKIIKGFRKTMSECEARSDYLAVQEDLKESKIQQLNREVKDCEQERTRLDNFQKKLNDLIGE